MSLLNWLKLNITQINHKTDSGKISFWGQDNLERSEVLYNMCLEEQVLETVGKYDGYKFIVLDLKPPCFEIVKTFEELSARHCSGSSFFLSF